MSPKFISQKNLRFLIPVFIYLSCVWTPISSAGEVATFVRLGTDAGEILLVLSPELAPSHVKNFLHLGSTGFYTGSKFHRVIPGFMIQGGDPNSRDDNPADDGAGGPRWEDVLLPTELAQLEQTRQMLANRGYVGLGEKAMLKEEFNITKHVRGTLSMARSQSVDSAGSQFFICVARASNLDHKYTAFGQVVSGLDVVDTIVSAPRNNRNDYPMAPTSITSFEIVDSVSGLSEAEQAAWQELQGETAMEESRP